MSWHFLGDALPGWHPSAPAQTGDSKVDDIPPGTREGVWLDADGDYWKFVGSTWHYQKGTYENDWEDTESDFEPEPRYGPFERVGYCTGCGEECDGRCGFW